MEYIKLKGAKNVRDFGGTVNTDGKKITSHCFIRGNALNELNHSDVEKLVRDYKLGTVIDLRTYTEAAEKPDKEILGVNYVHIPIIKESMVGISHESEIDKKAALNNLPDLCELYRSIVTDDYSVSQIKKVFEVITASSGSKAVLWHCTEGKDRCGLISALFLSLMDVGIDEIYDDYIMTNNAPSKNAKKYYYLVLLITKSKEKANKIKRIFRAEHEYLDAAFNAINDTYGSVDAFIKDRLGITDEVKSNMKSKYLEA
ncbi:MAG: tyrosine-protein phosphatase [Eubacterium sp.]